MQYGLDPGLIDGTIWRCAVRAIGVTPLPRLGPADVLPFRLAACLGSRRFITVMACMLN